MSDVEAGPSAHNDDKLAVYDAVRDAMRRAGAPMIDISEEVMAAMNPDEVLDFAYESLYAIGITDPRSWLEARDLI